MTELFLQVVNRGISATWLVLAVLVLRLLLKKAPKWTAVLLWGIVAVRLICPFSVESIFSLIPSSETIAPEIMLDKNPGISTGIPLLDASINPIISQSFSPDPAASANPLQIWIPVAACIWAIGAGLLLGYTAISYLWLLRRMKGAALLRDNLYLCENAATPFVLGFFRPRIYLPDHMQPKAMESVIAHEQAHIHRKDHWWKPIGFLLLSLYWFHPLMWLSYLLLCRDIELACDEKVIKTLAPSQRADYSQALLSCSVHRRFIAACPLAFGEVGVKSRVKSVLNYKKPAFWIVAIALILSTVVAVCFLTDPISGEKWGVKDIKLSYSEDGGFLLNLPYTYLWGSWHAEMLPENAPEQSSNGEVPYTGDLGKYRMKLQFGDTDLTGQFLERFPVGRVVTLELPPRMPLSGSHLVTPAQMAGLTLYIKVTIPEDHGFVIYVGSNTPFTVNEYSDSGERLFGTLTVPLHPDPDAGIAAVYDGQVITMEAVAHNRQLTVLMGGADRTDYEVVNDIITSLILLEEAERLGLSATQAEIDALVDQTVAAYTLPDGKKIVDAYLAEYALTFDAYLDQIRSQAPRTIAIQKVKDQIAREYCEANHLEFNKGNLPAGASAAIDARIAELFEQNKDKIVYSLSVLLAKSIRE